MGKMLKIQREAHTLMMLMATKMVISKMVDDDGNGEGHQIIDKKEEGDDHPRNQKSCSSLTIMMIKITIE